VRLGRRVSPVHIKGRIVLKDSLEGFKGPLSRSTVQLNKPARVVHEKEGAGGLKHDES